MRDKKSPDFFVRIHFFAGGTLDELALATNKIILQGVGPPSHPRERHSI
jgi:hypothetical protein